MPKKFLRSIKNCSLDNKNVLTTPEENIKRKSCFAKNRKIRHLQQNLHHIHNAPEYSAATKYRVQTNIATIRAQICSYEDSAGASTFELSSSLSITIEAGTFTAG
jgi:hypothetical protein